MEIRLDCDNLAALSAAKQTFNIFHIKCDESWPPMIALTSIGGSFHLAQQGIHLVNTQGCDPPALTNGTPWWPRDDCCVRARPN